MNTTDAILAAHRGRATDAGAGAGALMSADDAAQLETLVAHAKKRASSSFASSQSAADAAAAKRRRAPRPRADTHAALSRSGDAELTELAALDQSRVVPNSQRSQLGGSGRVVVANMWQGHVPETQSQMGASQLSNIAVSGASVGCVGWLQRPRADSPPAFTPSRASGQRTHTLCFLVLLFSPPYSTTHTLLPFYLSPSARHAALQDRASRRRTAARR